MSTEGASSSSGLTHERHLFMGGERPKGAALVCPALAQYVAQKMQEDAAVLKERRKGREERELLAAATATPGGGGRNRGGGRGGGQQPAV